MARLKGRTGAEPVKRNDAYTVMLSISLLALIGGCVLLYLDYEQYEKVKAPSPEVFKVETPAPAEGGQPNNPDPPANPNPAAANPQGRAAAPMGEKHLAQHPSSSDKTGKSTARSLPTIPAPPSTASLTPVPVPAAPYAMPNVVVPSDVSATVQPTAAIMPPDEPLPPIVVPSLTPLSPSATSTGELPKQ